MTEAAEAAPTTVSGADSEVSQVAATEQQAAATEQAGQQPAETGQAKTEGAQSTAPEAYQFAYPEGYVMDEAALGEVTGVFKEIGLTQDQAQKLVEYDAKRASQAAAAAETPEAKEAAQVAAIEAHNKQVDGYVESLKSDPEFGGAKFEQNVATAQKAIAAYGNPELTAYLDESGIGSHPLFVKLMHKVGKDLGEGSLHRTTTEQPAERSLAERMYPNYGNN